MKLYQRETDTRATIAQVPGEALIISGSKEELDQMEDSIARIANNRNKKAAAARRKRRDKIRAIAHGHIARGEKYLEAYEKAEKEVDGV